MGTYPLPCKFLQVCLICMYVLITLFISSTVSSSVLFNSQIDFCSQYDMTLFTSSLILDSLLLNSVLIPLLKNMPHHVSPDSVPCNTKNTTHSGCPSPCLHLDQKAISQGDRKSIKCFLDN